jgi:hypothetical protein
MALEGAQERAHAVRPYGGVAPQMGRRTGSHGAGEGTRRAPLRLVTGAGQRARR